MKGVYPCNDILKNAELLCEKKRSKEKPFVKNLNSTIQCNFVGSMVMQYTKSLRK